VAELGDAQIELPLQWQTDASYLMNQRDLRDADDDVGCRLAAYLNSVVGRRSRLSDWGSPIRIVSQLSDVAPGSTPIAFGNSHPILNWWCYKIPRYGSIAWG
jgi:hypothetical protein